MKALVEHLSRSPLFLGTDTSLVEYALDLGKVVTLEEKQVVIKKGEPNDQFLILLSAKVGISLDQKRSFVELGDLDCVGEMSMVDGSLSSADVVVLKPGEALVLPREAVWNLVKHSHTLAINLLRILTTRLRKGNEVTVQEAQKAEQFAAVAHSDALTGLYNRHWMPGAYERILQRSLKTGYECSLLFFDVDHFKAVNDNYGHQIGDQVLVRVAEITRRICRPTDQPVRYAGDEFTVLLPRTYLDQAFRVASRLVRVVEKDGTLRGLVPTGVTLSVGVTSSRQHKTLEALLEAGDEALYRAKDFGRNRASL